MERRDGVTPLNARPDTLSRRGALRLGSAGLATLLALRVESGSLAWQEATPAAAPFAGETFLGETSDPETIVALVVAEPTADGQREARAYVCDGKTINGWFDQGEVDDDAIALTSPDGGRLEGTFSPERITGTITLGTDEPLTFEATPATGPGGLYSHTVRPDGSFSGTSATGNRVEGEVALEPRADGNHQTVVVIILPNGDRVTFDKVHSTSLVAGEHRMIVIPDGRIRGARSSPTGETSFQAEDGQRR
jgi:hypothetical protein